MAHLHVARWRHAHAVAFYIAHVFLIPGMIFLFIGLYVALFRKAGAAGPITEDPVHPKLPP